MICYGIEINENTISHVKHELEWLSGWNKGRVEKLFIDSGIPETVGEGWCKYWVAHSAAGKVLQKMKREGRIYFSKETKIWHWVTAE